LKIREARKLEQLNNPHYLKGTSKKENNGNMYENVDNIPVAELDLPIQLVTAGQKRSDKYLNLDKDKKKKKKGKKSRKNKVDSSSDEAEVASGPSLVVNKDMELPEGATLSDSDSSHYNADDPHRALDIDLDLPSYEQTNVKHSTEKQKPKKVKKEKKKKSKREAEVGNLLDDGTGEPKHEKKSKKSKKDKKEKKKDKESKKSKKPTPGYEEAVGISTPSKEFQ